MTSTSVSLLGFSVREMGKQSFQLLIVAGETPSRG